MPKKGCTGPQRMDKGHSLDSGLVGRLYCSFHFLAFVNFKSLFKRLLLYVHFRVWVCAHECRCPQRPEAVIATRARVVGGYAPPSRDAGNQTQKEQYEFLTARRISSPRRFNIVSFPCSKYTKPGAFHTSEFFFSF